MSAPRYASLDVLRLLASFQMVQGHTLDALLAEDLRRGTAFAIWSWIRGVTSLAFLFAAGGSLAVVHHRTAALADDGTTKRLRRALVLLAVGYAMKVPVAPLLAGDYAAAWSSWVAVDILQCIGVLLLVTELLHQRLSQPGFVSAAVVIVVASVFSTSVHGAVAAAVDHANPLRFFSAYVAGASRFPIVPYAMPFVAGYVVYSIVSTRFPSRGRFRLARTAETLAGETLVIYVFHVVLLYADVIGLRTLIGPHLSLRASIFATVLVAACSVLLALAWHRGKRRGIFPAYL